LLNCCLITCTWGVTGAGGITSAGGQIIPGAERMSQYLPLLKGKRVAVFANQTAMVGGTHLVDTLKRSGINIVRIFSPEHGFRGNADAGEEVASAMDSITGIEVVSLYGNHLRPSAEELRDVDVLLFDVQDVGVRFYTYISSLQYYIQAALENNKPLILLDRPNPNGFYVDGPVLDKKFRSFVGMQPVPVVYGMTLGEYAKMLLGEGWIVPSAQVAAAQAAAQPSAASSGFRLTVIPCDHYTHHSHYRLPVGPSPNLPDMQSIYLYPSLCWFEGTAVSLGRGTDKPFRCFGHPSFPPTGYSFTPRSTPGAKNPPLKDQTCNGYDLSASSDAVLLKSLDGRLQLKWLLEAYRLFPDKGAFFGKNGYFDKLAGSEQLAAQIRAGLSEDAIRRSWAPGITAFRKIRARYLMYPE
jgi:uncharacterized protein YbbC (DUF1343 family)